MMRSWFQKFQNGILQLICFCCLQSVCAEALAAPEPIVLWHSLAGSLGVELNQLVAGFNKSQNDYRIKPIYKGEYTEALTSFTAAFRAHQPPDIIQVFEVGTATMLSPLGIIKPLYALLEETGVGLETEQFLPAIRAFYSKEERIMAMPFNTSVPVIFYNADLLATVGVNHRSQFPQTWDDLAVLAARLKKAGQACVYTTAYPAWIHIEAFAALQGIPLFQGDTRRAKYNDKTVIHHLNRLKDWQKAHYFEYGGRGNDATVLFTSGRCALFSQSSGAYKGLAAQVPFHLGVAPLPVEGGVGMQRHNNVIGGGALWAVQKSPEHYRGIALFYQYLSKASVQQRWYANTGYIPLSIQNTETHSTPILEIAKADLGRASEKLSSPKIPQNQIRSINDEALEAIFSNTLDPKHALKEAIDQANFAVERFSRNTKS